MPRTPGQGKLNTPQFEIAKLSEGGSEEITNLMLGLCFEAGARRDGVAVRAGLRVAEEGTDALVEFGRDDVLEAAGLLVRFGVFDRERVGEQTLGQAVAANDIAGATCASFRQTDFA